LILFVFLHIHCVAMHIMKAQINFVFNVNTYISTSYVSFQNYNFSLSRVVGNFLLSRASWCNPLNSLYNINKSQVV